MNPPRDLADGNRTALLTPPGRGAVAVVAAEGPAALATIDAHFAAANGRPLARQAVDRILFGHWRHGDAREEIVVCRTASECVEVQCHGGVAAAERIVATLAAAGCRVESWRQWVGGAGESPVAREARIALAAAPTRRTAAILLDQWHGALERDVAAIEQSLTAGDAPDEAAGRLAALRGRAALGRRLAEPWQVAIAGRPNVGKSSVINRLVGYQRAIVFDLPGTTRDVLAADTAIDGWPVRLTDGAGLRPADDPLEAAGVALAKSHLAHADLVVWVLDATELCPQELPCPAAAAHRQCLAELDAAPAAPLLAVINKVDQLAAPPTEVLAASALTGFGVERLLAAIAERLVPEPPPPGAATPFHGRQTGWLDVAAGRLAEGDRPAAAAALAHLRAGEEPPANRGG